jgi:pyruvate-formate lyase-activating enzyme
MKLLVLNLPPRVQREECCWGPSGRFRVFPFLLAQIVTVLKNDAVVEFFDANCEKATFESIELLLAKKRIDAIVCSVTPQYLPLESRIVSISSKFGIKCIAVPIPFDYAEEVVDKYDFHFAIYSEPEKTLLDWCRGVPREELKGAVYKRELDVIKNPPQESYFSKCPAIDWDKFDIGAYNEPIFYQIARGCPYSCKFCVWARKAWQVKPVETVLADLMSLERQGVRLVYLLCAQITTNKNWLINFCKEKIRLGIRVSWKTDVRANEVNRHIIRLMRDAGCVEVYMGVESFNQQILEKLEKKLTVSQIMRASRILNEEGIPLSFAIMFNVGETEQQVKEYINSIKEINMAFIGSGIVKAYRGTELFRELSSTKSESVQDMGVCSVLTPMGLRDAQRRLESFRNEKKKLVPLRVARMFMWYLTNRNARKTIFRRGIKESIESVFSSLYKILMY